MHVVIVMRSRGYYRFLEDIVEEIARRGGRTTIVTNSTELLLKQIGGLLPPSLTIETRQLNADWSARLLRLTRELRSYLHWLTLRAQPEFLLERWLTYLPRPLSSLLRFGRWLKLEPLLTGAPLRQALAWFEEATVPSRNIAQHIRGLRPDIVLITPLLFPHAWEVDYLKACRQLGQAHVGLVASWDNLTSKGVYHVRPDLILVWNDIQVREAIRYHSIPEARVVVVGAPTFDWLFTAELLQRREEFCRGVGLDPARPYVVYAASSPINHGSEAAIVSKLHQHLESLAPGQIQMLVRPYPSNQSGWDDIESAGVHVGYYATTGRRLVKINLLNTLYHAAAVVGLNTSVFLEATILDRPGLTLMYERADQDPLSKKHTLFPHFEYLLRGEFLDVVEDERSCAERIVAIVRGADRRKEARATFVKSFLRPNGMEVPASRITVNLLERLASASLSPSARPAASDADPRLRARTEQFSGS